MDAVRSDKRVIETSTVSSIQIFSTIEKVCTEEFEEDKS
jgi:hypothetical protein